MAHVAAPDVYLVSPRLRVSTDGIAAIEIRMRVTGTNVRPDGLFFTTERSSNIAPDKRIGFNVTADGQFHTYRINVGKHPKWRGQTVTRLRLDPVHSTTDAIVEIDLVRGVAE